MLKLIIQQRPAPRTRFTVKFNGTCRSFNTFAEAKEFLLAL